MRSIKYKLMLVVLLLASSLIILQAFLTSLYNKADLENKAKYTVYNQANQVVSLIDSMEESVEILENYNSNNTLLKSKDIDTFRKDVQVKLYHRLRQIRDINVMLINKEKRVIFHSNSSLENKSLELKDIQGTDLVAKMLATRDKHIEYQIKGKEGKILNYIAYVIYNAQKSLSIVVYADMQTILAVNAVENDGSGNMRQLSWILFLIVFIIIVGTIVASYLLAHSFSNPLIHLKDASQKISQGNLRTKINIRSRKDEIGVLISSFQTMIDNLKYLIRSTQNNAGSVKDASKNLASIVDQTLFTIETFSDTMNEIAGGAQEQAEETNRSVKEAVRLDNNAMIISKETTELSDAAKDIQDLSQKGLKIVEKLLNRQRESDSSFNSLYETINQLKEYLSKIEDFVVIIGNISAQTHLLALNASIESARAGAQGSGFNVLSQKIRKLAEETTKNSEEIKEVITSIDTNVNDVSKKINEAKLNFENQQQVGNDTITIFRNLHEKISFSLDKMVTITEPVKELEHIKNNINSIMNNIYDVTQQTAASSEELAASAQEQVVSIQRIKVNLEDLVKRSENMQASVNNFTV